MCYVYIIYVCMYIRMYICICKYVCMYVYMHTHNPLYLSLLLYCSVLELCSNPGAARRGQSSCERLLLENRENQYEEVFSAEMQAFDGGALEGLEPGTNIRKYSVTVCSNQTRSLTFQKSCQGLWRSTRPLDRQRLGQLASLRGTKSQKYNI
jgi:hypothetical protein